MTSEATSAADYACTRVLLAEDDPLMARVLSAYLGKMGCPASAVVGDGAAALSHLADADGAPDVFITDLNMPGMDGVEMLRHMAELGYRGNLILVSGEHADVLKTTRALAQSHGLNVIAALTKPVSYDGLAAAMAQAVNQAASKGIVSPDAQSGGSPGKASAIEIAPDEIRVALENGEFVVYYQPKAHIDPNVVSGVEALVRWVHPRHGLIGPDHFIHLAEQHGLIIELTDLVLREAIAQGGRWAASGTPLTVAVNISMDCLSRLDYPDFIARLADEAGFEHRLVMLEITESRLLSELTRVLEVLARLRMKGFGLSIDDFGTGYSSMTQLQNLPFTELKIDRAFVHGAQHDLRAQAIFRASAELGRRLDMRIVAEGVEEAGDLACIIEMGCDVVQGYILSKPLPAADFDAWHADWRVSRLAAG